MKRNVWNIRTVDPSATTAFAAAEFARLIALMDPEAVAEVAPGRFSPEIRALWIGVAPELPPPPAVADPEADDAIRIEVAAGAGTVTGSNPRGVLIAVYRFFREAGGEFVRPGRSGEALPRRDSAALAVHVCERAAYRHRGICLEGAVGIENALEMIDLAPKLGFNACFTQLFRPGFAFRRWYAHQNNPELLPTPVSDATIDAFVNDCDAEIRRRGLEHHRIGHGWISRVLGITSSAWHEANDDAEVRPDRRRLLAVVNGERKLYSGSGIDTNLCYSDPEAIDLLAREVAAYARENPGVRYLHFWLADHANNQCECDKCRDKRPADQYVGILNRIDEALAAAGSPVKVVFLIYLDLLWAPVEAKLRHPERFVLLYAPIRRSYSVPMAEDRGHRAAPFVRNRFVPRPEAGATLPYLEAWRRNFPGDAFVFDYHYMWDYLNDPGGIRFGRIMTADVENLRSLGLNGMMSCQNLRVFLPTGAGMSLMGDALWSGESGFDARAAKFFAAAFGADGAAAFAYLERLSDGFDPETLRGERPIRTPEAAARYAELPRRIEAFRPVIRRNLDAADPAIRRSWECLAFHAELCRKLAEVLRAFAVGDVTAGDARWSEVRTFARRNELAMQREFDLFEFLLVWENKILPRFRSQAEGEVE